MEAEKRPSFRRRFSVFMEDHETFTAWGYVFAGMVGLALLFFVGTFFLNTILRFEDGLVLFPLSELF